MSSIVIVPKKGSVLPVGECELIKETGDAYIVKAVVKAGRGRGVKTVLRQFVLPKTEVAYLYQEHEISAEEATKYPLASGSRSTGVKAASADKSGAVPAKRGRPKKVTSEEGAVPAKRGRGRPKKNATEAGTDAIPAKRGRGRPKKVTSEEGAVPAKRGRGRPKKNATEAGTAAVPAKRGRPKKDRSVEAAPEGGNGAVKRRPGRPKKNQTEVNVAPPAEAAAPPADQPAKTGGLSLFTDFGG